MLLVILVKRTKGVFRKATNLIGRCKYTREQSHIIISHTKYQDTANGIYQHAFLHLRSTSWLFMCALASCNNQHIYSHLIQHHGLLLLSASGRYMKCQWLLDLHAKTGALSDEHHWQSLDDVPARSHFLPQHPSNSWHQHLLYTRLQVYFLVQGKVC